PSIVGSFRLVEESAQLSASIPHLADAADEQQAEAAAQRIGARLKTIARYTEQLKQDDSAGPLVRKFEQIGGDVRTHAKNLRVAVTNGLAATQQRRSILSTLQILQDDFALVVDPAIARARDAIVSSTQSNVTDSRARVGALIDGSVESFRAVLEIQANVNFLIAVLNQVAATDDRKFLFDRRFAIVGPIADIRSAAGQIPETKSSKELLDAANRIIDLAINKDGVFALRKAMLPPSANGTDSRRNVSLRNKVSARLAALNKAQAAFLRLSRPMIEAVDAGILEAAGTASREARQIITTTQFGIERLKSVLLMHSETNQLVSLLNEAATARQTADITEHERWYTVLAGTLQARLKTSVLANYDADLREVVERIIGLGDGADSIFAVRRNELAQRHEAAEDLRLTRNAVNEWIASAQLLVKNAEAAAASASEESRAELIHGQWALIAIALIGLVAAVSIALLYVYPFIVRRLTGLSSTMLAIAGGNLDAEISVKGRDEITDMGRALVVFRDNALKRREAERALRESEERYALAIQGSTDALWDIDLHTGTMHYAERYWSMLGYSQEEIKRRHMTEGTRDFWRQNVHPDDLPGVLEILQEHLAGARASLEATYRFRRQDGSWCWVLSRGRAIRDAKGEPYRMTGTLTDITERVELENALREAKEKAEQALAELKSTQANLIQAEKMASLGQLTAGIAHEIKNPLNFVNNFSKLSVDLIEDMRKDLTAFKSTPNAETEAAIDELLGDLTLNLEKIKEHGQRADSIVRGMLEHSRETAGDFQPTDINALLDEFTNLAFHGMRAQTEGFNVTLNRDYEDDLGSVNAIPQDLSRVFLNIVTNAFQAVHDRRPDAGDGYDPTVWLRTRRAGDDVEIRIRDNGPGMPKAVSEKVFQPFFTTKAPGEGTGLGLSISYDIVVHEHGGTLTVESQEGEFTEFVIRLPNRKSANA
ncbi:MAG: PAS domain-containing protein, partial [Alphaproteobacteria bacterium]|nr:PAS domain-containing protein [Alphaproteobacteria bacterium]